MRKRWKVERGHEEKWLATAMCFTCEDLLLVVAITFLYSPVTVPHAFHMLL